MNCGIENQGQHVPSITPLSWDSEGSLSFPLNAAAAAGIASGVSFSAASVNDNRRQTKRQAMEALAGLDDCNQRRVNVAVCLQF